MKNEFDEQLKQAKTKARKVKKKAEKDITYFEKGTDFILYHDKTTKYMNDFKSLTKGKNYSFYFSKKNC